MTNIQPPELVRHASLFSGIGGFDLAALWMGWENVLQCEIDPFCRKVLQYHFPSTILYGDIRTTDFTTHRGTIDVLTAGTPCQPASVAGRRKGTGDNRWLWQETFRAIREIQPTWCILENVRGLTSLEGGLVFDNLLIELESYEYEVQTFCIPACAVDAPHRRERIWILGHAKHDGRYGSEDRKSSNQRINCDEKGKDEVCEPQRSALSRATTNAEREGHQRKVDQEGSDARHYSWLRPWSEHWHEAATRLCILDDGFSRGLDGITVSKWRNESIKAGGNAIVPQVAFNIFQSLCLNS